jgi:hypothetical protein
MIHEFKIAVVRKVKFMIYLWKFLKLDIPTNYEENMADLKAKIT